ncbi:hypothetical protein AAFF_G00396320 [Aldrovandia affinis]|uniref:Uncharacterized protein n=1 Tax=Aldrovandia affinis TaxID=143900 RepID=A0AAD7SDJ5_9TELE|nr:hypothetical protein AAFF_G00396320 [Aldrovandia affinis]
MLGGVDRTDTGEEMKILWDEKEGESDWTVRMELDTVAHLQTLVWFLFFWGITRPHWARQSNARPSRTSRSPEPRWRSSTFQIHAQELQVVTVFCDCSEQ